MSQVFKDNAGRDWLIEISVFSVDQIRKSLDIDLLQATDGKMLQELVGDPVMLVGVIWELIESQAKNKNISPEDFAKAILGDAVDQAIRCFMQALADFFPARQRALMNKMIEKIEQVEKRQIEMMEVLMDSGKIDQAIDRHLQKAEEEALKALEITPIGGS